MVAYRAIILCGAHRRRLNDFGWTGEYGRRDTSYGRLYLGLWLGSVLLPGTGASYNALDVVLALSAFYPML